jgi:SWI/SNF-related matrix-associated actin-dependent regulator of chromatin subfamily A protein 2/4
MESVADAAAAEDDELAAAGVEDCSDGEAPRDGEALRDYTGGYRRRQRRATVGSIESIIRNTIQAQKIEMADEVINAGRFDQRTTHEERRATLEDLLRADVRETTSGRHVVPRLRDLNAMLARSPEELRLFDAMDRDASILWPSWQGDPAELPAWLRYSPADVELARLLTEKPKGKGARAAQAAAAEAEVGELFLGRGVRAAASRRVTQQRNLAVRRYEQGDDDDDESEGGGDDGDGEADEALMQRSRRKQAAPTRLAALKFAVKLREPEPELDDPSAHASASEMDVDAEAAGGELHHASSGGTLESLRVLLQAGAVET